MREQAIEFFVDVYLLGQESDFLFESAGIQGLLQLPDSAQQPVAQASPNLGQPFADTCSPLLHPLQALPQGGSHLLALAAAGRLQLGSGLGQQSQRGFLHRGRIRQLFLDHARPTHQGRHRGFGFHRRQPGELPVQLHQFAGQVAVQLEPACRGASGGLEAQGGIDLAAREVSAEEFADGGVQGPKFLWQAQAALEETVIHRAHFPAEPAKLELALQPGKACHAPNHGCFRPVGSGTMLPACRPD